MQVHAASCRLWWDQRRRGSQAAMRPGRATPAGALAAVFQVLAARELACLCCCCCWEAAPQMNMRKTSSSLPPSSANTNCSSRGGSGRVECMHVQPCQACPAASGGNIKWLAGGSKGSPASDSSSQPRRWPSGLLSANHPRQPSGPTGCRQSSPRRPLRLPHPQERPVWRTGWCRLTPSSPARRV